MQSMEELQCEVTKAVIHLKRKFTCAVICAIIKRCRAEGISALEYTKSLQKKFIMKNQDSLNPDVLQRNLQVWQKDAVDKLKKVVPFPISSILQPDSYCDSQKSSFSGSPGGSFEWFENKNEHPKDESDRATIPFRNTHLVEDNVTKNAAFLESIIRLTEACKELNTVSTSDLHSVLYDKAEHSTSHICANSSFVPKKPQVTEDSGIGYSEGYTEESSSVVGLASSEVLKYALYSMNTRELVTLSLVAVVNFLKAELYSDCEEMFNGWERSVNAHICNIVKKCSQLNIDCRNIVVNFITEVIGDCWHCHKSISNQSTKMKIVDNLVWDLGVCNEVLQNIREKISMFNMYLSKKHRDVQVLSQTIGIFLSLYSSTCVKIEEHNRRFVSKSESSSKKKLEASQECAMSEYWMLHWCPKDQDCYGMDSSQPVSDRDIEVLECLIISATDNYPLISCLAVQALTAAKRLNKR